MTFAIPKYSLARKRIYVAGHQGMVGSALVRRLSREDSEILIMPRKIDLRDQALVQEWFAQNRPDTVLIAAAKWAMIMPIAAIQVSFCTII